MLARTPLALACTVLLGGCVSTVSIDVDDGSGFTQLATSIPLGDNSQTRLRLRWAEVGGEDSQSLDFGERIQVGNSSISGPAELDVEIDLSYYSIAIGGESDAHPA